MFHRIVDLVVGPATADEAEEGAVRNDWDRLRSEARTQQERDEIDTIFARHVA